MNNIEKYKNPLIYALDADGLGEAKEWVERLSPVVGVFKIGFQLFLREGPGVVETIREMGAEVFLDLKFHDIPYTVHKAACEAAKMGVFMFNVHASGGEAMMKAAAKGARDEARALGINPPLVLGVTILTSMDAGEVGKVGFRMGPENQVIRLARLAKKSGLGGVVASPREAKRIRKEAGKNFTIVCPGIRPRGSKKADQARVATPAGAIAAGADYIVVGRPIREAKDPARAAQAILDEALRTKAHHKFSYGRT